MNPTITWHDNHGTLRVNRDNVREIELVFNDYNIHFSTALSNEDAAKLAEALINAIGASVVFPVPPKGDPK